MSTAKLGVSQEKLRDLCFRWNIDEIAVFGSVLRGDFDPTRSDVDLMVTFSSSAHFTLASYFALVRELEALFGRKVDLVTRRAVESSPNWIRRKSILESAVVVARAAA